MAKTAAPHKRRTSAKRRRQVSSVSVDSMTMVSKGQYVTMRKPSSTIESDTTTGRTGRPNLTTTETTEVYTIHAAGESLFVRMTGCQGKERKRREYQLDLNSPGWSIVKEHGNGIIELKDVADDFCPGWIERQNTKTASKQEG